MIGLMKYSSLAALTLFVAACGPSYGPTVIPPGYDKGQTGLDFLPEKADRGYLFSSYDAKGKSSWRNNWAANLDLTGVSWNDPRCATLVAPGYVVMAAHFTRPAEVPLAFHDRSGKLHERRIVATKRLAIGDITVGKLDQPLPSEVKWYRFANASDATLRRPAIISHEKATLSVHRIEAVGANAISFAWIPGLNPVYGRNLISGDSGHPSFLIKNGGLVLLETHTSGGPGTGPFYGSPDVQAAVRAAISEMGN